MSQMRREIEGLNKEMADLYRIKAERTDDIEDYKKAVKLDKTNFRALAGRGLSLADAGKYNEAIEDLEAALALQYGDDDLDLAEKAYIKLMELRRSDDSPGDAAGVRSDDRKFKAFQVRKASVDDKDDEKVVPGSDSDKLADLILNIVTEETVSDDDRVLAESHFSALLAENGFQSMVTRVESLVKEEKLEGVDRILAFLNSELNAGEQPEAYSEYERILIELSEKRKADSAEKMKDELIAVEGKRKELLLRLAKDLEIEDADKLYKEGKLAKVVSDAYHGSTPDSVVRELFKKLNALKSIKKDNLRRFVALLKNMIDDGNFIAAMAMINTLSAKGDHQLLIDVTGRLLAIDGLLNAAEISMMNRMRAEAYDGMTKTDKASEICDAETPEDADYVKHSSDHVKALILKAGVLAKRGGASDLSRSVDTMKQLLSWRGSKYADERYDDDIFKLFEDIVKALNEKAKDDKGDPKVSIRSVLGSLEGYVTVLLTSRENVMKLADILLVANADGVPLGIVQNMYNRYVISNENRKTILTKVKEMVRAGALADPALAVWLNNLPRQDKVKSICELILGWEAFNEGKYAEADNLFRRSAKDKSLKSEALIGRAMVSIKKGKLNKRLIRKAIKEMPDDHDLNIAFGEILRNRNKFDDSAEVLQKALESAKDDASKDEATRELSKTLELKVLNCRYSRKQKGVEARLKDLKALFGIDEGSRKEKAILNMLLSMKGRFTEKKIRANRGLYLEINHELMVCRIHRSEFDEAEKIFQDEYSYVRDMPMFLIAMRDVELGRGDESKALSFHERACAIEEGYRSKNSEPMAELLYENAMALVFDPERPERKAEMLMDASRLTEENVEIILSAAEENVAQGDADAVKSLLERLKKIGDLEDLEEEEIDSFENLLPEFKTRALALDAHLKTLSDELSPLDDAAAKRARGFEILDREAIIAAKEADGSITSEDEDERVRLSDELGKIVTELALTLSDEDIAELDGDTMRGERQALLGSVSMDSFEFKGLYLRHIYLVQADRSHRGRAGREEIFHRYLIRGVVTALDRSNFDKAELLLGSAVRIGLTKYAEEENLLRARVLIGKHSKNRDDDKYIEANDLLRNLLSSDNLRIRMMARLYLVKLELANGSKIENVNLVDLSFGEIDSPEKVKILKNMLPEIIDQYLQKARAMRRAGYPRSRYAYAYLEAFRRLNRIVYNISDDDPEMIGILEKALDDMGSCISEAGTAAGIEIKSTMVDRLKSIVDAAERFSTIKKVAALFEHMEQGQYMPILLDILKSDICSDDEKIGILDSVKSGLFDDLRKSKLSLKPADAQVVDDMIGEVLAIQERADKHKDIIKNLDGTLGILYLLLSSAHADGSYRSGLLETAVYHLEKSGKDADVRLALIKAYMGIADKVKAEKLKDAMKKEFGRLDPDVVDHAEDLVAGRQRQAASGQIARSFDDKPEALVEELKNSGKIGALREAVDVRGIVGQIISVINGSGLSVEEQKKAIAALNKVFAENTEFKEFDAILQPGEDPMVIEGWMLGFNTMPRAPDGQVDTFLTDLQILLAKEFPQTAGLCREILDRISNDPNLLNEYIFHEIVCPILGHVEARRMQEIIFASNYPKLAPGEMATGERDGELRKIIRQVIDGEIDSEDVAPEETPVGDSAASNVMRILEADGFSFDNDFGGIVDTSETRMLSNMIITGDVDGLVAIIEREDSSRGGLRSIMLRVLTEMSKHHKDPLVRVRSAQAFLGKITGFRNSNTTNHRNYNKLGGWKLHLNVRPENYQVVDRWLLENFDYVWKLGAGGEENTMFTIYVGGRDDVVELASLMNMPISKGGINESLEDQGEHDVEEIFHPKIMGRFDIQSTMIGNTQTGTGLFYYGLKGLPSHTNLTYESPEEVQRLLDAYDNVLSSIYGSYYAGSDNAETLDVEAEFMGDNLGRTKLIFTLFVMFTRADQIHDGFLNHNDAVIRKVAKARKLELFDKEEGRVSTGETAKDNIAVIGIVGKAGEEAVKGLSADSVKGLTFVFGSNKKMVEESLALENEELPSTRILVDVDAKENWTDASVRNMLRQARLIGFMQKYPYMSGLDSNAVAAMEESRLRGVASVILRSLPKDSPFNSGLDAYFDEFFENMSVADQGSTLSEEDKRKDDAIVAELISSYSKVSALGEQSEIAAVKLSKVASLLKKSLAGKSPREMERFEAIAMSHVMEDEAVGILKDLNKLRTQPGMEGVNAGQTVVIDARSSSGIDFNHMRGAVARLIAKTADRKLLNICVISDDEDDEIDLPSGVIRINSEDLGKGQDFAEQVAIAINDSEIDVEVPASSISIITGGSEDMVDSVIYHVNMNDADSANFVISKLSQEEISSEEEIMMLLPVIAVLNLAGRALDTKAMPRIAAVGEGALDIADKLDNFLGGLIQLTRITSLDVGKMIRQELIAITKTLTSV